MKVKTVFLCDVSIRRKQYRKLQKNRYCDVTVFASYDVWRHLLQLSDTSNINYR